jgi:hypothetical protein
MVFGMPVDCSGCDKRTTRLFAAQYRNGDGQEAYICEECYKAGSRCWVNSDGSLVVAKDQPDDSRQAVLYWDEGLMTTGGEGLAKTPDGKIVTYPKKTQPS